MSFIASLEIMKVEEAVVLLWKILLPVWSSRAVSCVGYVRGHPLACQPPENLACVSQNLLLGILPGVLCAFISACPVFCAAWALRVPRVCCVPAATGLPSPFPGPPLTHQSSPSKPPVTGPLLRDVLTDLPNLTEVCLVWMLQRFYVSFFNTYCTWPFILLEFSPFRFQVLQDRDYLFLPSCPL